MKESLEKWAISNEKENCESCKKKSKKIENWENLIKEWDLRNKND